MPDNNVMGFSPKDAKRIGNAVIKVEGTPRDETHPRPPHITSGSGSSVVFFAVVKSGSGQDYVADIHIKSSETGKAVFEDATLKIDNEQADDIAAGTIIDPVYALQEGTEEEPATVWHGFYDRGKGGLYATVITGTNQAYTASIHYLDDTEKAASATLNIITPLVGAIPPGTNIYPVYETNEEGYAASWQGVYV